MTDITLKADKGYFNYRVGAIIIDDKKLLMVKDKDYPYYYSVGGRVKFGENSEEAVLREAYEETQITFEIERLAFIHENFFIGSFKDNKPFHEISLFFLMRQNDEVKNIKRRCNADGALHWLPLDDLARYRLFPEFFKTELQNLKNEIGHFLTENEETVRMK